jgi:hypothetical protein
MWRSVVCFIALTSLSAWSADPKTEPAVQMGRSTQESNAEEEPSEDGPNLGWFPRPFLLAGAGLNGGGYQTVSGLGGAGLMLDSKHFAWHGEGYYNAARKTNDGTGNNPKGHDRGLVSSVYLRFSNRWLLGAGARWSQLSTTNYTKTQWRPTFGVGLDYFDWQCQDCDNFSTRLFLDYVLPGSDWRNGLNGPLFSMYIPSPARHKHWFLRETFGVFVFHDTVTDPTDRQLTREQTSHHSVTSFAELTMMYRF